VIADANVDIERRAVRQQRLNDRRYEWARWLAATDEVLGWLEAQNLQDVSALPAWLGERIRERLSELPERALAELRGGSVQEVLDSVFEVQEQLLRQHDPYREEFGEEESGG